MSRTAGSLRARSTVLDSACVSDDLMALSQLDSTTDLSLLASERASAPISIEQEVLLLFDQVGSRLLRYVASFGLGPEEAEDIVQEIFLALVRHLRLGRARSNLRGWLFQVAHNLALRQRRQARRQQARVSTDETALALRIDPAPSPEARLAQSERRRRLTSVVCALPERDRRCLFLRAEGLAYRDIAAALGVSLGTVAKSMARAVARLMNADRG
jgi:RNA polymerase sigma-70 factor, ECF subfamily